MMKSLSSSLQKKSSLSKRPVSILNIAQMIGLSKPFNLSNMIRILEIEPPLAPEILFPQRDQVIDPHNIIIRWRDPGKGTSREANLFYFELRKRIPSQFRTEILLKREVSGQTTDIAVPTLEYNAEYYFNVMGRVGPWWGLTTQSPFTTIKQPQQTVGYSKIIIFNCNTSKREVNVWLFDRNLQNWDNKGSISQQYDEGGLCPGVGEEPLEIELEDGHVYDLVCVDTGLIGCGVNDPTVQACQRRFIVGIVGKKNGFTLDGSVIQ